MADTPSCKSPGTSTSVPVPRDITPREDGRIDLIGLPRARIAELFAEAGLDAKAAKLRAKQVYHWLYHRGVTDFAAMTDIAKTMRPWLARALRHWPPRNCRGAAFQSTAPANGCCARRMATISRWCSSPMPTAARCASPARSAARSTARFCHTGTMRLVRNLTPGEIVGQVMLARDALGEWPKGSMAGFGDDDGEDEDDSR